jgi:hypothetical protein
VINLQGPLGLYQLFEAALDSELAFDQKLRRPAAVLLTEDEIQANPEAHYQNDGRSAHLIDAEKEWLRRRNYNVPLKSRVGSLKRRC